MQFDFFYSVLLHLYFVCVIVTHRHTGCTFFCFKKILTYFYVYEYFA